MQLPSKHPDRVVVVGGGLAGMAAAARLAKAGHPVELFEAADRLGGSWAPRQLDGVLVDRAPGVVTFPAPWRDLFRKSGRTLEAELARTGYALRPAPPPRFVFADDTELVLPPERGEAYDAVSRAYGASAANQWRDLIDHLDDVWQAVRPLGLESELLDRRQLRPVRALLRPRHTIRGLAREIDEPHLAAIVTSIAYRVGSTPDQTPAWCAVELSTLRTFGRWVLESTRPMADRGRTSVLVDALSTRLALRQVAVHLNRRVTSILSLDGRASGVVTDDGARTRAAAVICTADPWSTVTQLLPTGFSRSRHRAVRRLQPAQAPLVSHQIAAGPVAELSETITLSSVGRPTLSYPRPTSGGTLLTTHDHNQTHLDPSWGVAWHGFRSWLDRPSVTTEVPGLFLAGPSSAAGNGGSQVILSGALAAYAAQSYLRAAPPQE